MEKIEINKIKKNRTYTYEEIKEMFEDAAAKTCVNPFGDIEKLDKNQVQVWKFMQCFWVSLLHIH